MKGGSKVMGNSDVLEGHSCDGGDSDVKRGL